MNRFPLIMNYDILFDRECKMSRAMSSLTMSVIFKDGKIESYLLISLLLAKIVFQNKIGFVKCEAIDLMK